MTELIREYGFVDGYAVGELTGRLKHQAPAQIKQWVPLEKMKSFKSVLQKYNYSITNMSVDPADSSQMWLVAEKMGEGTDPNMVLAFANGNEFMNGWEAGCLAGRLRYSQPEALEEWVKVDNIEAIQQVVQDAGYTIASTQPHPEHQKWLQISVRRQTS